ncbi:MAG: hypothetical protein E4H20_06325 [Spirochaetales bacterium]|nr:MAG: hypothetical protein E4H20_06325 [Spirochaetales bacterium]
MANIDRRRPLAFLLVVLMAFFVVFPVISEEYNSDRGFYIDLPEEFTFVDGDVTGQYTFASIDGTITVTIVAYDPTRFASIQDIVRNTLNKLAARGTPSYFQYAGRDAALMDINFGSGASASRGMAFFIDGSPEQAARAESESGGCAYDLIFIAHTASGSFNASRDVIRSAIDGFSADFGALAAPGPIGTAARAALGPARTRMARIMFGKAALVVPWDPREGSVAQETVEREYRVLTPYGASPELVEAAIRRFYRMAWRDSAPSLDRLALELVTAWETGAWAGTAMEPRLADGSTVRTYDGPAEGPRYGAPADPRGYAAALLSWTQKWVYERSPKGSDVVNPLSAAMEGRGDCDSRAMALSVILRREDIESVLLISLAHEHALAGIDAPGPGARFPYRDTSWLVAETTARVDIGLIDASQSAINDWFAVDFPF